MAHTLRIGTRDSQLAVWQSTHVQQLLKANGVASELVMIKSDGDLNLQTPLYEMGVQGIFTRALDIALLEGRIDAAVHSMKDVPVTLAKGLQMAAVLERASHHDILVYKGDPDFLTKDIPAVIASSSIRRIAQWLHRYPHHTLVSLRGNVNTRLRKLAEEEWNGAIFAAAGLERIGLRPDRSINLDWMLPAPAQGAIVVVCRQDDAACVTPVHRLHHEASALCTHVERSFLRALQGGCSSPVSALARLDTGTLHFTGSITSHNGKHQETIQVSAPAGEATDLGTIAAGKILSMPDAWIKTTLNK